MRRSWLFLPGAESAAHAAGAASGADVLIQELEDFTPPELRPRARALAATLYDRWRKAGVVAGVRVNPLETCGREDLAAVMRGRPDIVFISKVERPEQIAALDRAVGRHEAALGIKPGRTELVPNVETAAGLMRTFDIARASPRVRALLVASEDMVADLGTSRSRGGEELAYVRGRFLVECRAAGVEAIDCPYTFSDAAGAAREARAARRLGYAAKSLVDPSHARAVNRALTPSARELAQARRIIVAFERARAAGKARAHVAGALVEVPIYAAAKRLIVRWAESAVRTRPRRRRTRR
jgi:citrate lyase subunit beta/citryl-CoA lyase